MRAVITFLIVAGVMFSILCLSAPFLMKADITAATEAGKKLEDVALRISSINFVCLVTSIILFSACFYMTGTGRPREFSHLELNHVYEVFAVIPTPGDKDKSLVVTRNLKGKIRVVEFIRKPDFPACPGLGWVKIVANNIGQKTYEAFPPPEKKGATA